VGGRVGERSDHGQELDHRAGPAVGQQQRRGIGGGGADVDEMPEDATTVVALNSSAIYAGIGLSGALALTTSAGSAIGPSGGPAVTCAAAAVIAAATAIVVRRRHCQRGPVQAPPPNNRQSDPENRPSRHKVQPCESS